MNETNTVVSHYYPLLPHTLPHQQDFHPGMMYPQQIPPTVSTDFYSMQPYIDQSISMFKQTFLCFYLSHFYSPAARVPYPGQPLYPPGHHQHQMNGYHLGQFEAGNVSSLHQPNAPFPPAPTSTLISPHLQSSAQSISIPALSKVEFDKKQRHLQQQ